MKTRQVILLAGPATERRPPHPVDGGAAASWLAQCSAEAPARSSRAIKSSEGAAA